MPSYYPGGVGPSLASLRAGVSAFFILFCYLLKKDKKDSCFSVCMG
jgi:hypothetical protein